MHCECIRITRAIGLPGRRFMRCADGALILLPNLTHQAPPPVCRGAEAVSLVMARGAGTWRGHTGTSVSSLYLTTRLVPVQSWRWSQLGGGSSSCVASGNNLAHVSLVVACCSSLKMTMRAGGPFHRILADEIYCCIYSDCISTLLFL